MVIADDGSNSLHLPIFQNIWLEQIAKKFHSASKGKCISETLKPALHCIWLCAQSCQNLCDPWIVAPQAPLSMGFSRQEYWRRLPFPPPGDLPLPRIKPVSLAFPALAGRFFFFFTTEARGNPYASLVWPQSHLCKGVLINPGLASGPKRRMNLEHLFFHWISLVAQMVKNLSAMQETEVWFLGREDSLN